MTTEKPGPVRGEVLAGWVGPIKSVFLSSPLPRGTKGVFLPITPDGSVGGLTQEMLKLVDKRAAHLDSLYSRSCDTEGQLKVALDDWMKLQAAIQAILDQVKEPAS